MALSAHHCGFINPSKIGACHSQPHRLLIISTRKSPMHPAIAQHRSGISAICQRYRIRRLEVFGSAARAYDFDPESSDADFLVDFESGGDLSPLEQFFGLADGLQRLLGRPVDLVERGAVRNPFVLAGINRAREVVYAA